MNIDLTDATDAAWEVLHDDGHNGYDCRPDCPTDVTAERAVRAALPHIETQIRERVAAEIEAEASHYAEPNGLNPQEDGECIGLSRAAEIARGTTRKETDHA